LIHVKKTASGEVLASSSALFGAYLGGILDGELFGPEEDRRRVEGARIAEFDLSGSADGQTITRCARSSRKRREPRSAPRGSLHHPNHGDEHGKSLRDMAVCSTIFGDRRRRPEDQPRPMSPWLPLRGLSCS
jgi:hypothetical protein